jgi:hypothetical protein
MVTSFWSVLILLVVGVIAASSVFELFSRLYQESRHARQQLAAEGETLESRLAGVAESMMNASAMLALVQTEIEARAEKARQLAAEVEERERLIELTQEQKDAVAELKSTARRAGWQGFIIRMDKALAPALRLADGDAVEFRFDTRRAVPATCRTPRRSPTVQRPSRPGTPAPAAISSRIPHE